MLAATLRCSQRSLEGSGAAQPRGGFGLTGDIEAFEHPLGLGSHRLDRDPAFGGDIVDAPSRDQTFGDDEFALCEVEHGAPDVRAG